jgi:hypothetical protein
MPVAKAARSARAIYLGNTFTEFMATYQRRSAKDVKRLYPHAQCGRDRSV